MAWDDWISESLKKLRPVKRTGSGFDGGMVSLTPKVETLTHQMAIGVQHSAISDQQLRTDVSNSIIVHQNHRDCAVDVCQVYPRLTEMKQIDIMIGQPFTTFR